MDTPSKMVGGEPPHLSHSHTDSASRCYQRNNGEYETTLASVACYNHCVSRIKHVHVQQSKGFCHLANVRRQRTIDRSTVPSNTQSIIFSRAIKKKRKGIESTLLWLLFYLYLVAFNEIYGIPVGETGVHLCSVTHHWSHVISINIFSWL